MRKLSLLLLLSLLTVASFGQPVTFSYTGAVQTYTVPCGVTSITVDVAGGQGGTASGYGTGGYGGRAQGTISVTAGQVLYIYVGQAAATIGCSTTGTGGSNSGGGAQGGNGSAGGCIGAAGGGSSDIRTVAGSTTTALNSRLIVAGGGGGGSWDCGSGYGGAGGGTTGSAGTSACGASSTYAGQPGTPSAGGAGASSGPGGAGSFGVGGTGTSGWYGGGGGGGWYGGGGGYQGGGGGGSSYISGTGVTSASTTTGYQSGNGYVVITAAAVANVSASPSSLNFGMVTTSTTSSALTTSLTGTTMTSGGTITITPPANFEVSLNGSTWSSSAITYSYSGTTFSSVPLYVRFAPTASTSYSGNVTITGGGLGCTVNIPVNGTGATACSGTPSAGVATGTVTFGSCTPYASTVSLAGATVAAGLTYQWQSSPDNITFTNVSGATNTSYSTTVSAGVYYRATVTCSSSGLSGTSGSVNLQYPSCPTVSMPSSGSTTACNALFYDSGGPSGNYADYETRTFTFYPGATGTGSKVSVHFNSYYTECSWDYLYIYSGNSTAGTLMYTANCSTIPPDITSTAADGSLTFYFTSDGSVNQTGWSANITNTSVNPITGQPAASTTKCFGGPVSLTVTAAGSGNSYQWYDNGTTNSNSGGSLVPGATSATFTPNTWDVGTKYYYARVNTACGAGFSSNTAGVTITAPATAIAGTPQVCTSFTTALTFSGGAGTWSSSTPAVGTVDAATGVVTGVSAGTTMITYVITSSGCGALQAVTVNSSPNIINGTTSACEGSTTTLANTTPGGTWSSSATTLATVGSATGVVTGVSAGFVTITYTAPTTCYRTVVATINPLPVTTITPSSPTICAGEGISTTANAPLPQFSIMTQDFNSGFNGWTVSSPSGDPASAWRITTTPVAGISGDGTPMLESDAEYATPTETILTSPSFATLGYGGGIVTFNQYLISLASSDAMVNVEYSIDNGATWSTILDQVGVSSGSGSWSSSTPEASITLPAGALGQSNVKLRWHYNSNFGLYWYLDNIRVLMYQPAPTYAWAGAGGATGLSCTACANPTITPATTGANVYSVTTTTSAGCQTTVGTTVSVNPLPGSISGLSALCVNSSITLTDADAGGTWSSPNPTVIVDATGGVVVGQYAGTAIVTYTLPTGCRATKSLTVNPQPTPITGTYQVCEGRTRALGNSTPGGTWSSSMSSVASVSSTGVVTGVASGFADIYYTLTATGCSVTANMTVDATPAPIGGSLQVCAGLISPLTDAVTGGSWVSSNTFVASVDGATGDAWGHVAGTSTITYTLPTGCRTTSVLTVNPLPAAITGTSQVCEGLSTPLSDATSGGVWSSSSIYASVSSTGVVTGMTAGVETITYQLPTTCIATKDVTVNTSPAAIAGNTQVCAGLSTPLSDLTSGGTWSSGTPGVATISSAGLVNGVVAGNSTITYQLATGCKSTVEMTVNPLPSAITGTRQVCEGLTSPLGSTPGGGAWSSSAVGTASIDASGIVSGLAAGVATITYELPTTCITTADVTVNPLPAAIAGSSQVCEASSTALNDVTPGGTWSSSNTTAATVSSSGVVFGASAGATTITYALPTTCISTYDMTVNPIPAVITGTPQVCEGFTTNLGDVTPFGTWSSNNGTVASIDATGTVSGFVAGVATISYTLSTGCNRTVTMVVNTQPAAIAGATQVCQALTTALSNSVVGGTWSSSATTVATVGATSGIVSGLNAGNTDITYTMPGGCNVNTTVTVNPTPAPMTGVSEICVNTTATLGDADAGGVWSSSLPALASVDPTTGVVTGLNMGTATITYTLPTSCITTAVATVDPIPAPIAGIGEACEGASALFTDGSAGGTWTASDPSIATINSSTGGINAITAGTMTVTYALSSGCLRTRDFIVNPLPAPITGTAQLCESGTTVLADATGGGVWSSGSIITASINAAGSVSGVSAGITGITYMLPTGCKAVTFVTVNQLPAPIDGSPSVCEGQTTSLSDLMTGGTWSTGSSLIATANPITGAITGVLAGTTTVIYTLPTGCLATRSILVNPTPAAIAGAPQVCQGSSTPLSNTVPGGVWTSSNPTVAPISLTSGLLTGNNAGTVTVSYTLLTGCASYANMVVNPLPSPVSGSLNLCNSQTSILSTATTGGTWVSSDPLVATVTSGGVVTGVAPGNVSINYMLSTGCARSSIVTVNALPSVFNMTGGGNYCAGGSGVHIGVDGSNTGISYHLYAGSTPVIVVPGTTGLPIDFGLIAPAGTYNVIARNPATGCISNMTGTETVTINAIVAPDVLVSGSTVICSGAATTYTAVPTNGGATPAYVWRVNGTVQPGATSATFNYIPLNGDVVTSTMTSSAACATPLTASSSKTITVNPNVMPVVNFTATPGLVVCEGNAVTFDATSVYGGSAPTYTWYKGTAVAGTGSTFTYTPANGDHISLKLASNYTCRLMDEVTSPTVTMATSPVYVPAITITINPGTHIQPGANVTLTANVASAGPAPVYQWYINNLSIPSATNGTFTYSMFNDGDSVSCQVTGTGLCGMSAFNSVIMHVGPSGIATTGAGVSDVRLVPNPNKGLFTVKGILTVASDEEVTLEVTNMLGQVVYRKGITAKNGIVDEQVQLNNTLANGMYMLNLKTSADNKVFHFVLEQ